MGLLQTLFSKDLGETTAWCQACAATIPARYTVEGGRVWLDRACPVHGADRALQSKHARYYRLIETMLEPLPEPKLVHEIEDAPHLRGIFVDVTESCNLRCPNCLVDAKDTLSGEAPSVDEVMADLAKLLPYRPVVYLTGGEPTVLPELDDWIRKLTTAGYDVKVLSNGLKLVDYDYCKHLYDAGARWMLLQFDSLDGASLEALRGHGGLTSVRLQSVENLSKLGFNIDLACMIDRNHNFGEMGDLLRLGFATKGVRHVSLMPSRRIGRGLLTDDDNVLEDWDMMAGLAEQTGGAVRGHDFIAFFAAMAAFYKATGHPDFAPRRCFLPLPLVGTAKRFRPATRLSGYLRDPRNLLAFYRLVRQGVRAESSQWNERTLLTSIETFREHDTIDVRDAARCSRYYLVDGKVQQACHRNVMDRPVQRRKWEEATGQSGRMVKLPRILRRADAAGGDVN